MTNAVVAGLESDIAQLRAGVQKGARGTAAPFPVVRLDHSTQGVAKRPGNSTRKATRLLLPDAPRGLALPHGPRRLRLGRSVRVARIDPAGEHLREDRAGDAAAVRVERR